MEYQKLVAVSGLSGLFELVNSKTDGAIVKSLDDKVTRFASSRSHQFSHLESIEIYTIGDNVNLVEVFIAMDKNEKELPPVKDEKAIRAYFNEVYPNMDFDRVYTSDMKKMIRWFEILKKNNIELNLRQEDEEEEGGTEEEAAAATEEPAIKEVASETATAGAKEKKAPAKKKAAPDKKEK